MTILQSALVGTDFSAEAMAATRRAASIARETGLKAVLAHVLPGSLPVNVQVEAGARAQQALSVVAQPLQQEGLGFEARLLSGDICGELVKAAAAFDLVIAGARGEDVVDFAMGRTSVRLVRYSNRPTLIVRRTGEAPYRRVLAAVDFSEPSRIAAACAAQLAPQAQIELVHAFEVPFESTLRLVDVHDDKIQANRREAHDKAAAAMTAFAAGLGVAPARLTPTVTFGHPSRVILERAKATGAQLIVIGKHAAGFIERLVVGSVALQVLDQAQCDVLVVPETL